MIFCCSWRPVLTSDHGNRYFHETKIHMDMAAFRTRMPRIISLETFRPSTVIIDIYDYMKFSSDNSEDEA